MGVLSVAPDVAGDLLAGMFTSGFSSSSTSSRTYNAAQHLHGFDGASAGCDIHSMANLPSSASSRRRPTPSAWRKLATSFKQPDVPYADRPGFLPSRPVSCSATGHDLQFDRNMARVVCPANCAPDKAARVIGLSIHPNESAVCASAIADGVLPENGGEIVVTKDDPQVSYEGSDFAGHAVGVQAGANMVSDSYKVYAVDTADMISSNIRVIDEKGYLAPMGRAELRTDKGWGSICGLNHYTAQHVCREMGYKKGFKLPTAKCGSLCGARGSPVAAKNVVCSGDESSIQYCKRLDPDAECRTHMHDSIVWCTNKNYPWDLDDGRLRLIDEFNQPTKSGTGRLEMWWKGRWRPIHREGYTDGVAATACRTMGYSGIDLQYPAVACDKIEPGKSYCGGAAPGVKDMQCKGSESDITDCSFRLVHTEFMPPTMKGSPKSNLVIKCVGYGGEPSGKAEKERPPRPDPAPFVRLELECDTTFDMTHMGKGPPGTTAMARCPAKCGNTDGGAYGVFGSGIYAGKSKVCSAAIHNGLIAPDKGGEIVVTTAHPIARYRGSDQHGIVSDDLPNVAEKKKGFVLALPTEDMFLRYAKKTSSAYAGASALGAPLLPKLITE
mmetsp:Transcript_14288/g.35503  ORF Transcript_14288/g.35503 Transcript_14288/m.35503 type:complete len:611 (+) Transcript_14288:91-1923(+)|eukprot:CAMPEP_0178998042 /NCGR_PEP_ID=MMETSP0795-20121207/9310_1 /TAXON_ID=88552 /ORGANISM="Amoebophrya sp., Strain Ameob2" /LENGTH=610 /DNA_ID=CAMNT_0020690711 /DNA_START=36 /DNA_END=1868 /DNA_ORIENTATION=-